MITRQLSSRLDPIVLGSIALLLLFGLSSMSSLDGSAFVHKQLVWISVAFVVMVFSSLADYRFLRRRLVVISIFATIVFLLALMFILGSAFQGAQSWLDFGSFAVQPSEFAKLALIIVLAKYFSRRHIEIASFRHIIISGIYAGIIALLILLQPDFGSAMIVMLIWFFMLLVSGISKKHIIILFLIATILGTGAWQFVFKDYQKERILTFIHPMADIKGAGYNAYQSTVAVGSGELFGKGIGYGTQSKLKFLPEYETDFIFAAFAEEWGFAGVLLLFITYLILIWRLTALALRGASNFEVLFALGVVSMFVSHFLVNIGMNIGLLPVTGVTLPFMSYGGSHLVAESLAIGIILAMHSYARTTHKIKLDNEFLGV